MQFILKVCNSNKINQVLYEVVHMHFYREIKRAILPISLAKVTKVLIWTDTHFYRARDRQFLAKGKISRPEVCSEVCPEL